MKQHGDKQQRLRRGRPLARTNGMPIADTNSHGTGVTTCGDASCVECSKPGAERMATGSNGDLAGTATPDIDEAGLKEWIKYGLAELEGSLAKHAAFDEWERKRAAMEKPKRKRKRG